MMNVQRTKEHFSDKKLFILLWITVLFVLLSLILSCATMPRETETEESLRAAATRYWQMRMDDKYKAAFDMEDQEVLKTKSGEQPPYEYYLDMARGIKAMLNISHAIKDVTLLDGKGRVNVEFVFRLPDIPKPIHQAVSDEWVFREGRWLHQFR